MKSFRGTCTPLPFILLISLCFVENKVASPTDVPSAITPKGILKEEYETSYEKSPLTVPDTYKPEETTTNEDQHWTSVGKDTVLVDRKDEFWEFKAGLLFQAYGGIVVVILGFFGNILALAVLTTSYPMNSTTVYLIQLAVSDLGVICVGQLSRNFPRAWTGFDTGSHHPWICKTWFFVNHSFKTISGWTLVAVTIERVIVVYLPFKAKTFCTIPRAKIVIAVIDVLCMGCYLHYFWTYGSVYGPDGQLEAGCTIMDHKPELAFYITEVRPWQDLFIRTGGPFFVLLTCNCLIVGKLLQQLKRRKQMAIGKDFDDTKTKSMTKMLLTVSFAFLFLISPMQIMYLVDRSDPYGWVITERWQAVAALRWGVTAPLYYLNHAINFILYCISGNEFRLALRRMFLKVGSKLPCACTSSKGHSGETSISVVTVSAIVAEAE